MDAIEFIKTWARICKRYGDCQKCILSNFCDYSCYEYNNCQVAEQTVANVEQWAKEHPVKTRQSEFLKQWPDAKIGGDGLLSVQPCHLCVELIHCKSQEDCKHRGMCGKCRRDFWLKEIE